MQANPSGTATLSLCDVAATSGLAMRDRVDALAAAIRGLGVLTPVGVLRKEVAERLSDGDLSVSVPESPGSDETARLQNAFRSMAEGLRTVLGNVTASVRELSTSATEISATAQQSASTSAQQASTAGVGPAAGGSAP